MDDIGLFNQVWKWVHSKKNGYFAVKAMASCGRDKIGIFIERHWPMVVYGCTKLWSLVLFSLRYYIDSFMRGARSFLGLGSAALLVIMWSCFLSLTSISCLVYVLLSLGTAGVAIQYVGYTPGLFITGLFGILILWMYANFWITGTLFIVGGCLFSLNHARLIVLMATMYALYYVKTRAGWLGILLSINLGFLSHDLFNYLLQWCDDNLCEATHVEQRTEPLESFTENEYSTESKSSPPSDEAVKVPPFKVPDKPETTPTVLVDKPKEMEATEPVRDDASSVSEMERILSCKNYYEALGFSRSKSIDVILLKKEYRKKAMLVHPDKNMGSPLSSESFQKLQCAYEVLSDAVKKRDYDDVLRKEESRIFMKTSPSTSRQDGSEFCLEESRQIQCTKCGNSHIWVCTKRTTSKARWCQDCCQFHQAKDGDGWIENKGSLVFDHPQSQRVEIPRAFVCAESKIFDVSEWAICQGMACRPNTHRPSFHVNMVGMDKSCQRSMSNRYPWDLYDEMIEEDEEFELWLQEAVASGLFCETSKRRKSWGPFKLPQTKGLKQWRRSS